MLGEIDESWMKLIKMGRIHRGNRLLAQILNEDKKKTKPDSENVKTRKIIVN
ncbi:hypothetical protein [Butyrivibrio sp. WCD2001]|uniref:hypothetical protein n=1 Tax=Butyrivibrio sp. WCD2001 TaxID=1280681 RepID=UPI0003F72A1D|nr:hypothetical protein [Butyrivibrio sp. WCD2001]